MRPPTRLPAWSISVGTHTALAVAIALAVGYRQIDRPPPLRRLVWVEPEAPRAGLVAGASDAAADSHVAPPVVAAPPDVPPVDAVLRRPVAPRPLAPAKHLQPASTTSPPASAPVAVAPDAREAEAAPGIPLGTGGAASNGLVGGRGDAPLSLRDVAVPPEIVDRVLPEFPARARTLKIEGQVVLEVVLDRSGRVEDAIHVTRSIPLLDAAAIAAVRQWRFRPARSPDGRPVRVVMEIPVRFVLH